MAADLRIPARLAATVVAWEGEAGRAWLRSLPRLVAEVAEAWDLEVGPPFEPGGQVSWVAPARRRHDGLDVALKVQLPHPDTAGEGPALRAWAGGGAALLHDHDLERGALLLERCRPGRSLLDDGGTDAAVAAGAAVGAALHARPAPDGLRTLAEVLDAWAAELAPRLDQHPTPDPAHGRVVLDIMRTRPRAVGPVAFLHGDLNPTNVLSAERAPWLAIDPQAAVGDPAYDAPRLVLQPDPCATGDPAATLQRRVAIVAEGLGVATADVLAWCLVHAVERGASAAATGDAALAAQCEAQVALVAAEVG
jgi:streptomycin 6-kinase